MCSKKNRYLTQLSLFLLITFLFLFHTSRNLLAQAPEKNTMKFVLSAKGLPEKGMWKSNVAVADINNDGNLDISAHSREGDGPHVWLGDGKGNWTDDSQDLKEIPSCGGEVKFSDINKDNNLDLIIADACDGISVLLGDGKGHWKTATTNLNPAISKSKQNVTLKKVGDETIDYDIYLGFQTVAIGDVNEDGYLDLVAGAARRGGISVYFGDGSGKNWKEATSDGLPSGEDPGDESPRQGGWANQVLLHDMNGDGHLDIVATSDRGPQVWHGDGKGRWSPASNGLPVGRLAGLYRGIDIGDVNEDGLPDLVATSYVNGVECYLQKPDRSWQEPIDVMPGIKGGARAVALADLDRDGHLDAVACALKEAGYGNVFGLFVARGSGKGSWTEVSTPDLPSKGLSINWGIGIGDFNKDGLPDLAVSTGGVVPEPVPPQLLGKLKEKFTIEPELPLPRMQVWLNQWGK